MLILVGVILKAEDVESIKKRLKVYRNVLVFELEFRVIVYVLFKFKVFVKSVIDFVFNVESCNDRVENFLFLVEDGDFEVVKEFVIVLKDFGYSSIVELIDLFDIYKFFYNFKIIIFN